MTISDRLKEVRGDQSQQEFARTYGVSARTYWNYENGSRPPSTAFLRALAEDGWNPTWVITGEGERKLETDTVRTLHGVRQAEERGEIPRQPSSDDELEAVFCYVPYMSVTVGAGAGQVVESEQIVAWMAFRRSYLQMLGVPAKGACLLRVKGDSMYPSLHDGDTVLTDTSDTTIRERKRVQDPRRAYAFREPGADELSVKFIELKDDGWLITGADHWGEKFLSAEAEKPLVIGRVRWSGRTWG